jgi:serine/threonine protein kinase/CHASE2 domain-containing sensor protein
MKECRRCWTCHEDGVEACPSDGEPLARAFDGPAILDGKYRLERRLGQGGMGLVYRARHLALNRTFALKLIRPHAGDPSFLARFRVEAEALGKLKHPNIVDVTDFGVDARDGGVPYLVMEHLEGSSLSDHCRRHGPFAAVDVVELLGPAARALDFAHDRGVLHRDLKPANVFLARDGGGTTVKILDFGLARLLDDADPGRFLTPIGAARQCVSAADGEAQPSSSVDLTSEYPPSDYATPATMTRAGPSDRLTASGTLAGTPTYMAPELFRGGDATRSSDIYAVGVMAYEMLTGRHPFYGSLAEVSLGHLSAAPPPPSSVRASIPSDLDAAILEALRKEPETRPRSATAFVGGLRAAVHRVHVREWRATEVPRRLRWAAALGLVAAAAGALADRSGAIQTLEARTVDARFATAAARAPDPRIVMAAIDEATLAADPAPLAEKADEIGRSLSTVVDAGARAVSIDLLLPQRWSRSEAFSELVLRHLDRLTLAAATSAAGDVIGPECLSGLAAAALGPERAASVFGFVNVVADEDGVVRKGAFTFVDESGGTRESWPMRTARVAGLEAPALNAAARVPVGERSRGFWIDYSTDWRQFRRMSWKDVGSIVERDPEAFRDRVILLGADFAASGDEPHRVPRSADGAGLNGFTLQALMLNTLLSGLPVRDGGIGSRLLASGPLVFLAAAAVLCLPVRTAALSVLGLCAVYLMLAVAIFRWRLFILPVAVPVLALLAASGFALTLRAKLPRAPVEGTPS